MLSPWAHANEGPIAGRSAPAQTGSAVSTTSKLQVVDPVAAGRSASSRPLACPCPAENDCESVHASYPGPGPPPPAPSRPGMFSEGWGWAIPLAPLTVIATVSGVVDRPVVHEERIVARPILPLTLTFDQAVVDGAPAARASDGTQWNVVSTKRSVWKPREDSDFSCRQGVGG